MSIWYDGTNLNMYRGDSGTIRFNGLPIDQSYRAYFSVKSVTTYEIIFEDSADVVTYYATEDGKDVVRLDGETDEEYIARCKVLVQEGKAFAHGRADIFVTPDHTSLLGARKDKETKYYYGLKICNTSKDLENTLIPTVTKDTSGNITFNNPPYLIVKPKYVEGTLTYDQYCDDWESMKNPKDYGIQPLLSAGKYISISEDDIISVDLPVDVSLTKMKQGDVLIYDSSLKKLVNKPIDDVLQDEYERQETYMTDRNITKVSKWLYEITYKDDSDFDYALQFFKDEYPVVGTGCSAVRNGIYIGRNFDSIYNNIETFVISTPKTANRPHASIGIANGSKTLTDTVVESGKYRTEYKTLPYKTIDGINDACVSIQLNAVVAGDSPLDPLGTTGRVNKTTGTNPYGVDICAVMIPRLVLDNAGSVDEAIELIESYNVYCCYNDTESREYHFMISDTTKTVVVEFVNNKVIVLDDWSVKKPILTNFFLYGYNGVTSDICPQTIQEAGIQSNRTITRHAKGTERYKLLKDSYETATSVETMSALLQQAFFRKYAYSTTTSPFWYSDYLGTWNSVDLTIDSELSKFSDITTYYRNIKQTEDSTGVRQGITSQSISHSVYNLGQKSLTIIVQEDTTTQKTYYLEESSEDIDGGNAGQTVWRQTIDGGSAGQTEWEKTIDGGNAGQTSSVDGGGASGTYTSTIDNGTADVTVFENTIDGGNS